MSPNPPLALPAPDEATELLRLPYIMPAQAQKHVTHNEALRMLDALVHLGVASRTTATPPTDPAPGERHLVPEGGDVAWGHPAGTLLAWQDGAWAAHAPRAGWVAWVADEATLIAHDGEGWIEAGGDASPATLGINATADDTNRLTVSAPATLLTHEGDDHRLTINKAGEPDTASLLFQSGWSGRAEMGLAGTDDFALKVSPDGAAWRAALVADRMSGDVSFPAGANGAYLMPTMASGGGPDGAIGPPNMLTVSIAHGTMALAAGRIHFAPLLVDRPTELEGAIVTLASAASGSGTMRAGLYALGAPDGAAWRPGARVVDLGTASPASVGNVAFDLAAPVTLEPGWYLTALGTDASGAMGRFAQWLTPGAPLTRHGPGAGTELRAGGATAMLLDNNRASLVRSGFPAAWPDTIDPLETATHYARQMVIPRWRRWDR